AGGSLAEKGAGQDSSQGGGGQPKAKAGKQQGSTGQGGSSGAGKSGEKGMAGGVSAVGGGSTAGQQKSGPATAEGGEEGGQMGTSGEQVASGGQGLSGEMKGSSADPNSTAKEQVASGKAPGKEKGVGDSKTDQKGQGDKTAQEGKGPTDAKMTKRDTGGEQGGGGQGTKDIRQLRQDIQKTLKDIDYDLKRLKTTTQEGKSPSQPTSGGRPTSGKQEQKASPGGGTQPGQDKALEEQTAMGAESGGPQGKEMGVAQQGQEGTSAPNAGAEAGKEMGYSPMEGTKVGGMGAGDKPGDKLFSEREEEMGPPGERGHELRLKADKASTQEKREVLSTGQEVVEGAVPFKQHSPTVEVDPYTRLGKE
ncbi:MAG: hypothetical protein AAB048_00510, partial [Planctomycetota bacterium]